MRWVVLVGASALAAVATAGVVWPFRRASPATLERLADPLEDERRGLIRALRDLEEERASGSLPDEEYRALRTETELRAVAVLRAIEARNGEGELGPGLRDLRPRRRDDDGNQGDALGRRRLVRLAPALAVGLAFGVTVVALLAGAIGDRTEGEPFSGSIEGAGDPNTLAFHEQRVRDHPDDVAARLDLAQRYQLAGDVEGAVEQYVAALTLDRDNAEAHANLGYLVFVAGRPEEALREVDRALAVDPAYPEALYFRGLILLEGLDRPDEAAQAFRAYLEEAPFGSRRAEVSALLDQAERA